MLLCAIVCCSTILIAMFKVGRLCAKDSRNARGRVNLGRGNQSELGASLPDILRRQSNIIRINTTTASSTKRISTSKLSPSPATLTTHTKYTTSPIMPRQSRGPASAPKRPSVPTPQSRSAPQQPAQARQASTVAQPPANQHAPPPAAPQQAAPAASGGSGLFGQMASTAA